MTVKSGQVVFLFQGPDWRAGRVIGPQGVSVEIEQVNGHRGIHGAARFARVSEKVVPSAAALGAYEDELHQLMAELHLDILWTLCSENPEPRTASELATMALPNAGAASDDAMAWALHRDGLYFSSTPEGFVPRPYGVVEDERMEREATAERARRMDVMATWLRSETGPVDIHTLGSEAAEMVQGLEALAIWDDDRPVAETARTVLRRLGSKPPEGDGWAAFQRLVELGIYREDENLSLRRAGLPSRFSPDVLVEVARVAARDVQAGDRKDYRALLTVAVDDSFTTEIDDAFAFVGGPNPKMYVFIADPAEWVPEGSAIDREARQRGATLYIPEDKVPMLPEPICDDKASLVAGQDRYALAFVFDLNERGGIFDVSIEEAIIRVDFSLAYKDVDAIIKGRTHDASDLILSVHAAAERLRVERQRAGSITVDRRDVGVHCMPDGQVEVLPYRTDDPSRRMVAEWMIQTSCHAAGYCRERGIPAVYRTQIAPDERPRIPEGRVLLVHEIQTILKTMRRAELTTEPLPHAGLGLPCYTQVTSPLRRYADLLMHRQLRHAIRRGVPRFSASELMVHFESLDTIALAQRDVERESRRFWLLRHLETRVGQRVKAEVVRMVGNRRWVVELVDYGVSALYVPPGKAPSAGETLVLLLKGVEPRRDKVTVV